ncbi:hypothetical protein ACTJKC_07510 [Pedobacter sp. 22226]|uniref:hypothetical protein n=1 Tax=Pedobacter sp. 22226 TaxID=3453894 RepID=UPI003F843FF9
MTYKRTLIATLKNCKWIILSFLLAVIIILFAPTLDENKTLILMLGVFIIFLILNIPQIYLLNQYEKVSNYESFQIDYENSTFIIATKDGSIQKKFSDLKNVQYHKPAVPTVYLSLMLKLCEHLYFFKLEFQDNSKYYLTSLLSPKPMIVEKGALYNYFIMVERKFASIK